MTPRAAGSLVALAAALALLSASAAEAHSVLERTVPDRGQELAQAPEYVAFFLSEPIEASFGAVRVFDGNGDQVETGEVFRPDGAGDAIAVTLPPDLGDGTYTATFRGVSADSHPISGGFVFAIGDPGSGSAQGVSELIGEQGGSNTTSVAFWADRWLGYLAIGVGVGLLLFGVAVWRPSRAALSATDRAADEIAEQWWRAAMTIAISAGIATSLVALPLQGAVAAGTSFFSALDPSILADVLDTRFGTVMAIRATAWAGLAVILFVAPDGSAGRLLGFAGAAWLLLLIASPALAGHASTQDPVPLLLPSAAVHVAAMSLWFGGLVALAIGVPRATRALPEASRANVLSALLSRFSPLALASVVALAATGTIQAIVEVGSVEAFVETAFGRAVLIKIGLLAILIGLAAVSRQRLLPAVRRVAAAAAGLGALERGVWRNLRAEIVVIVVILGVTAALVSYAPPG